MYYVLYINIYVFFGDLEEMGTRKVRLRAQHLSQIARCWRLIRAPVASETYIERVS